MGERHAIRLTVRGQVQGVGFRPGVYRLASACDLAGTVRNTPAGVVIELEGEPGALERFEAGLPERVSPLARIDDLERQVLTPSGREGFAILASTQAGGQPGARIPYDVATCEACLAEVNDPADRRHGYPFTNCTQCGPRFTIVEGLPYDRPKTAMKSFPMCPACRAEYEDPEDRRYHAEPIACPDCGPRVWLTSGDGEDAPGDPIAAARRLLGRGRVVAVRGLGGFHLAVDASLPDAVARLRRRKRRQAKPFALMAPDLMTIERFARVSSTERALLVSARRPIVLLDRTATAGLADGIAPGNPRLGWMLPYTPLHHLLLAGGQALVMTSGNLTSEPIAKDNAEALDRLATLADAFLLHDRPIRAACDDSVVYLAEGHPALVRRSRGYAPEPVALPAPAGIVALGGQQKNTFCLTRDGDAVLSQHIGDLDGLVAQRHLEACLEQLTDLVGQPIRLVACDLHPDYHTTRLAERLGARVVRVQHHHAHLAACLADGRVAGPAIGLCLDGTGYGPDGTIWGGELLVGDARTASRVGRIRPFRLPGGEAAIREPWRAAAGLVAELHGASAEALAPVARAAGLADERVVQVATAAERGVNAPWTSSLGRLFDAISALLSICARADYDGHPAVALEAAAAGRPGADWPVQIRSRDDLLELDWAGMVQRVLEGLTAGAAAADLAAAFHDWLVASLVEACRAVRARGGPAQVALSGGCMLNRRLQSSLSAGLRGAGFEVFTHRRVPANDGGLCLGQAAVAAAGLS